MKCSKCGGRTQVLDSRPTFIFNHATIKRFRKCMSCEDRSISYEVSMYDLESTVKSSKILATLKQVFLDLT